MVHVQNLEPKKYHNLLSTHEMKEQNNLQTHIHPRTSMSTYNFDIFLVPQCASAYHIFHYNLVIIFMRMHKWSFRQKSWHEMQFVPKFRNRWAMEFFQTPMIIDFSKHHLLPRVFQIHQNHNSSNIKLQPTQKFTTLTLTVVLIRQLTFII